MSHSTQLVINHGHHLISQALYQTHVAIPEASPPSFDTVKAPQLTMGCTLVLSMEVDQPKGTGHHASTFK